MQSNLIKLDSTYLDTFPQPIKQEYALFPFPIPSLLCQEIKFWSLSDESCTRCPAPNLLLLPLLNKPELKPNPDRLCANCLSIYLSTRGQMKPTKRETTIHTATKREGKRQRVTKRETHNKLPFSHCINPQPSNLSRVTTKFINSLNCHMSFLFQFQFSVVFVPISSLFA